MTDKLRATKSKLKLLASEIRSLKGQRKKVPNGVVPGLADKQWEARHYHLAYCLVRGRRYEEIERKRSPGTPLYKATLSAYLRDVTDDEGKINEIIQTIRFS